MDSLHQSMPTKTDVSLSAPNRTSAAVQSDDALLLQTKGLETATGLDKKDPDKDDGKVERTSPIVSSTMPEGKISKIATNIAIDMAGSSHPVSNDDDEISATPGAHPIAGITGGEYSISFQTLDNNAVSSSARSNLIHAELVADEQLRQHYTQEVFDAVVHAAEVLDPSPKPEPPPAKKKWWSSSWFLVPFVAVLIGLVVVAIVVPLVKKINETSELLTSTLPPTMSPTSPASRVDMFRSLLLSTQVSTEQSLTTSTSPQSIALDWLANDDPASLPVTAPVFEIQLRYVLAVFYFATGGTQWRSNCNFLSSANVCSWKNGFCGVTCGTDGVVQMMNFSDNSISQSMPPEIAFLKNLTFLQFESNKLTGRFPTELLELSNLTFLNIDKNDFSSGTIPSELGKLTNLEFLGLGGNRFTGTIPVELYNLTNSQLILLFDNELTGSIAPQVGNLTKLTQLSLNVNKLNGTIPTEIGLMGQMTFVEFGTNRLTGSIPSQIGNLTYLKSLFLYNNSLTGTLPTEIASLYLENLQIHLNDLRDNLTLYCNLSRSNPTFFADCSEVVCPCCDNCQ